MSDIIILEEIFNNISGLTKLKPDDEALIQNYFFNQHPKYANSWLYTLRATRNNEGDFGYKLMRDGALIFIGYRNGACFIINPVGENILRVTLDVCKEIRNHIDCPIVLRKIDKKLAEQLLHTKIFSNISYIERSHWLEDDLFPEHQIKLDKLFLPDLALNRSAKKLRKSVQKFEKMSIELRANYQSFPLKSNYMINTLSQLTHSHIQKYTAYLPMLRGVFDKTNDKGRYQISIYLDGEKCHGLYITETLNKDTIGLYCAISSMSIKGITEWMDADFFRKAFQDGIKSIIFGGSETKGVHEYVQKLLVEPPEYSIFSLLYSPKRS